jgi:hypothetical protein
MLVYLIFGKKAKSHSSNSLTNDLIIFGNFGKTSLQRVNIRTRTNLAS